MHAVAGMLVGVLVGLTGVGGGSLMTPLLILLFGIHPSTAVGTDLLYAAATKTGGSLIHGTARDWARFGEFLRNKGAVKGAQLVPSGWIEFMVQSSPRNRGYGAQVWLNRPQADDGTVQWPGAPATTFSMNGHLGQYVVVAPTLGVTVVRLGKTPDGQHEPVRAGISRIIQLFD